MLEAVEFKLADGGTVAVTATAERSGSSPVGLEERVEAAQKTLRQALAPVTAAASEVLDSFRELAQRPDELEVTFGVQLDGKLGGVIASASAGAHLDVTLRWHASEPAPAKPGPDVAQTAQVAQIPQAPQATSAS
jgi:Trypsin-co-occurring domain 1